MYFPVIYPSSGEFWLNSNDLSGFSRSGKLRSSLPPDLRFQIYSSAANEVADILNLTRPLHLSAPDQNFKRNTLSCIVHSNTCPFPPDSFVHLTHGGYDIYMASPELSFLLAARSLDLIDLVKFGYDLCAVYTLNPSEKLRRAARIPCTRVRTIKDYLTANHSVYGASKALKALRYVCDYSHSPIETNLAMFSLLPQKLGGCGLKGLEINKVIELTDEGRRLTGYPQIHGDLVFCSRLVVEYNSSSYHLKPWKYADGMNRQTALNLAGYDHIAVTSNNIRSLRSLTDLMNAVMIRLGKPLLDWSNPNRSELYFRLFPQI